MGRRPRLRRLLCRIFGHVIYSEYRVTTIRSGPKGERGRVRIERKVCARCGWKAPNSPRVIAIDGGGIFV